MTGASLPPHAPAPAGRRPVLVTGGAGFIGSNLVDRLAADGHDVLVYDSLDRPGVERNLNWLIGRHPRRVTAIRADVRDHAQLAEAASGASAVFHLAAQVAVTTSLAAPKDDFDINLGATIALLEALRHRPDPAPLLLASTNKVYGDLGDVGLVRVGDVYRPDDPELAAHGIAETRPLDFHTPYGCSKGGADQYALDYARSFGVPTAVMRMSCIYGPRQMGTEDQGWVAHFLLAARQGRPVTVYGDGRQVRDILFVDDAVDAWVAAWQAIDRVAGRAFNLGGGPANAVSLLQVLAAIGVLLGRPVATEHGDWRAGDQRWYVSDTRAVRGALALDPPVPWRDGLARLAASLDPTGTTTRRSPPGGRPSEPALPASQEAAP